jgi:UDP-N-acetylmuramoylalanine--D-glutamate ligase
MQLIGARDEIAWYDDSKATTPHAVIAAMGGFDSGVLIAGGRNKGVDLSRLAVLAPRLRAVVAIGEAAQDVAEVFGTSVPVRVADDMVAAVTTARALARAGDAVVLSPACASFDWYPNYGARGDDFSALVRTLVLEAE